MRFCILPSYILAKLYNISYSNKIVIYYQGDEICIFEYLFILVIKKISLIIHQVITKTVHKFQCT